MGMIGGGAPAELRAYTPTARDNAAAFMIEKLGGGYAAQHFVQQLMGSTGSGTTNFGAIDATPIGAILGAQDSGRLAASGHPIAGGAQIALGAIPVPGVVKAGRGMIGKAAQAAEKLAARAPVTEAGYMIPGAAYTKAQQQVLREVNAGPKGAGPLDLSSMMGAPSAPQAPIQRWEPPRGISPRLSDAIARDDVKQGLIDSMKAGQQLGADKWYHTEPIYQAFQKELGPEEGHKAFSDFMGYVAATSPRSDVSTNIRNASYFYATKGQERAATNPQPYGHVAQNLHKQNVATVEGPGWDVLKNPKPASFQANLEGNLQPVTVDTHAVRNIGMRTGDPRFLETSISETLKGEPNPGTLADRFGEVQDKDGKLKVVFRPQRLVKEGKLSMDEAQALPGFWTAQPNDNEYGAAEQLYTHLGHDLGLAPADAQAAAWAGAGDMTGLDSPPTKTFPELFNERVAYTAKMRGEDPQDTLRMLIRRQKPLLGATGLIGGAAALSGMQPPPQQQPGA